MDSVPLMPHDGAVQVEQRRDEKIVAIGTALAIFVLAVVIGGLLLWLAGSLGLGDGISGSDELPLCVLGGLLTVVHLARARVR